MDALSAISPVMIWTIIGVVLIIVEMFTVTFFILPIGIGALATAFFLSIANFGFSFQLLVFFIASGGFMVFFQYYIKPRMKQGKGQKTNVDRLIGIETELLEEVAHNKPGKVKIDGKIWRVKSDDKIEKGAFVVVAKIEGVTLTVIKKGI